MPGNGGIEQTVCCGGPPPPKSPPCARAGYRLCTFVDCFKELGSASIPIVETSLSASDWAGMVLTRIGIKRHSYTVSPGLYGVGNPDNKSPVIVTANYKLSFDSVRSNLAGHDVWLLVLDTCGINVWCAAGKKTFSTDELVRQIDRTALEQVVDHRQVIVPQLGATGVAAHRVKKLSDFSVTYGPVRAADLGDYLDNGFEVRAEMRRVTFSLFERMVLIPVELFMLIKSLWWLVPLLFLISGISPTIYSLDQAWSRGLILTVATAAAIISGAVLVPLLLPYLPGRSFALKGLVSGALCGTALVWPGGLPLSDAAASWLWVCCVSSYLGMNFTGSTPFTSPSGVEWEMKRAIPIQIIVTVIALGLWVIAPLTG